MNRFKKIIVIVLTGTLALTACMNREPVDNPSQPRQKGGGRAIAESIRVS